jgi:hypothetical protein
VARTDVDSNILTALLWAAETAAESAAESLYQFLRAAAEGRVVEATKSGGRVITSSSTPGTSVGWSIPSAAYALSSDRIIGAYVHLAKCCRHAAVGLGLSATDRANNSALSVRIEEVLETAEDFPESYVNYLP